MIALWQFITKRGSTFIKDFVDRGSFCVLELWSFRLYLGASSCIYIFGSWCIFYLFELSMIGGDTLIIFFLFHIVY